MPTVPDLSRRAALQVGIAALVAAGGAEAKAAPIRAVAFDAFPVFNPKAVFDTALRVAPDHASLGSAWFQKAFSDAWLRTAARRYVPFDDVLAETLDAVAGEAGVVLAGPIRDELLASFRQMDPWPDARERLATLKAGGLRLAFVSNLGEATLRENLSRAGLGPLFDAVLTTDRVKAFKPAPEAYGLAMRELGLPREQILFAPFAAWDAAGAAWFGYPTAWVNRARQRPEPGAPPVRTGPDLQIVLNAALG